MKTRCSRDGCDGGPTWVEAGLIVLGSIGAGLAAAFALLTFVGWWMAA